MAREIPVPIPNGTLETDMAHHFGRFGYFPEWYPAWAKRFGGVPARVYDLAARYKAAAPWLVPESEVNPHPGVTSIHYGPAHDRRTVRVPTSELLPGHMAEAAVKRF